MQRVNVAYALVQDEQGRVLMVYNRRGTWSLPGGMVEDGETLTEAVVREAKEETGLTVTVHELVSVNEAFLDEKQVLFFTFLATATHVPEQLEGDDQIIEVAWKTIEEANALMSYLKQGIEQLIHRQGSMYTLQNKRPS
ncbi:NUDIX hydrolase [Marinicrinis sediminis]|uniref:NUDIX hydrolase n=1 Tax=Marinicrinis sediminis TaxID=1652465 RepID=A0ABW5R9Z4_9BACL